MKLQTPKGFRDFLPEDAIKRKVVMAKIVKVFEKFGFDPLETPTLEFSETLLGKYGEEGDRLMYNFETLGGEEVAMRYDQTVPLARVIAQYGPNGAQKITIPFKRYQIQSAYRGENTQKGRYREFMQCDADIVGVSSPLADAEILGLVYEIYQELGLEVVIKINDRQLISDIEPKYLATIDKINKIGEERVLKELESRGLSNIQAKEILEKVNNLKPSQNLEEITKNFEKMGYPKDGLKFDPSLIRGLDYYTGLILEIVLKSNPDGSSLCGGGRWDKMIGKFTGLDLPAIGFAIGFDRTIEAMGEAGSLDTPKTNSKVLVTIFNSELVNKSLEVTLRLRSENIPAEIWLDPEVKLEKQLKYADQKGIPSVVFIGPEEVENNQVTLKNLKDQTQKKLSLSELISTLS